MGWSVHDVTPLQRAMGKFNTVRSCSIDEIEMGMELRLHELF